MCGKSSHVTRVAAEGRMHTDKDMDMDMDMLHTGFKVTV